MGEAPNNPQRRVLVVAYFFPPLGGGGVQRTMAFLRHLPAAGWTPVVIAPRDPGYEIRDPDLATQIPVALEVHRSRSPEPWWHLFRRAQALVRRRPVLPARWARPAPADFSSMAGTPDTTAQIAGSDRRLVTLAANVFFPDEHITWLPFAVRSARRVARRGRVDVLFSTSPPITGHLIAGLAARSAGVPWVADFRDPWIGNPFLPPLSRVHRIAQRWIENWIVSHADRVVASTPMFADSLRERYPEHATRIRLVTNGYDEEELGPLRRQADTSGLIRLVYAGSVYGGVIAPFVAGIRLLASTRPDLSTRLRVEFVGWLDAASRLWIEELSRDPATAGLVTAVGHRPRAEALRHVAGADVALYLLDDDPRKAYVAGGKLYEYLGLGLPILAVIPSGDARLVLESVGWGTVVDPDPESVCEGLIRILTMPLRRGETRRYSRFDRSGLAVVLGRILEEARTSPVRPRRAPRRGQGLS